LICAGGEWLDREMTQSELVAASRQKGKWTDGGMPLGYDIKGKKLAIRSMGARIRT
jgi:hypothetical protein